MSLNPAFNAMEPPAATQGSDGGVVRRRVSPPPPQELPEQWVTGPGAPAGADCGERCTQALRWQPGLSHLDQPSQGDEFKAHGVHYVTWRDTVCNCAGRPALGWKSLWILGISTLLVANSIHDVVTVLNINDPVEKDVLSLLTIGMTYLLGVRISLSYDRYYEARKKWGMMVNRTRDLVRQFHGYVGEAVDPGAVLRKDCTRWTIAFVYACKQHLRWEDQVPDLRATGLLDNGELRRLEASRHMPNYCLDELTRCVAIVRRHPAAGGGFLFRAMDENIQSFEDQIGACERILKTPVPFSFVLHLRSMILLNVTCLPLYLMGKVGWMAIPVTCFYGYMLTGLEDLGNSIENPFRKNWHALPLTGICETIKGNLLEIQARNMLGSGGGAGSRSRVVSGGVGGKV